MKKLIAAALAALTVALFTACANAGQLAYIGDEAARAAALTGAGLSTEAVTFLGTELASRDGVEYYLVSFTSGDSRYESQVDALSGVVIQSESMPLTQSASAPAEASITAEDAKAKAAALQPGQILLLENLRFDKREEKNGADFAEELAKMADVYVSDAFGTVHRAHASTAGVAAFLPAYAGFLVEKEISVMGKALSDPARPFVAILGGAKVSDKIGVINNLLEKADTIIVGGGMAYTFKMAQGHTIGKSLLEADRVEYAKEMMDKAAAKGVKLLLPVDSICAAEFSKDAAPVEAGEDIPDDLMGMDIGPKTVELYCEAVKGAGTIVWNGPMGVFEFPAFANGTWKMAEAVANSGAVTIIGGGDSASAVEKSGQADKITHISTGGGASLEFLEGLELPGVACLLDK